tara:strand:- start:553 stop:702 length:150 start_codon:yes stop_codon:yes gene_type:complete
MMYQNQDFFYPNDNRAPQLKKQGIILQKALYKYPSIILYLKNLNKFYKF